LIGGITDGSRRATWGSGRIEILDQRAAAYLVTIRETGAVVAILALDVRASDVLLIEFAATEGIEALASRRTRSGGGIAPEEE
jgi:hypothetical protein